MARLSALEVLVLIQGRRKGAELGENCGVRGEGMGFDDAEMEQCLCGKGGSFLPGTSNVMSFKRKLRHCRVSILVSSLIPNIGEIAGQIITFQEP